jgi:hypothetical protein
MESAISLDTAYRTHIVCKTDLLNSATQVASRDAKELIAAHQCDLEHWLKNDGERLFGEFIEFGRLIASHEKFYAIVVKLANIASTKAQGTFHHELISSPQFTRASIDVGVAVNELKTAIERAKKINA